MEYLESVGGESWGATRRAATMAYTSGQTDGQDIIEFNGRLCYRSWEPGLNLNVTKVRKDQGDYLLNILKSGHGSVLEHANYGFVLKDVSRVLTHELVRHRAGTAISQESLRYVRSDQLKFWVPPDMEAEFGPDFRAAVKSIEQSAKKMEQWMAINEPGMSFEDKKKFTSAIRRLLPQGMGTDLGWTANVRTLRHCIEMRTAPGAEVEIRVVFDQIAKIMAEECPLLFGDYDCAEDGAWTTKHRKV